MCMCVCVCVCVTGAQFGGKYFCHDVRVIRLPRHGASCPIGIGVSCSAGKTHTHTHTHTSYDAHTHTHTHTHTSFCRSHPYTAPHPRTQPAPSLPPSHKRHDMKMCGVRITDRQILAKARFVTHCITSLSVCACACVCVCVCVIDRQALAKVTREGVFIEALERNPSKYLPDVTTDKLSNTVVKVSCRLMSTCKP